LASLFSFLSPKEDESQEGSVATAAAAAAAFPIATAVPGGFGLVNEEGGADEDDLMGVGGGVGAVVGVVWSALVGLMMVFFLVSTIQEVARQR
jgi:hypothetical protein